MYPEVEQLMKEHPNATLYLNGELDYSFISDIIHRARASNIPFSIVTNKEHRTTIGLVFAYDYAINKEEIYIKKNNPVKVEANKKKRSFFSRFVRFLKR